MNIMTKIHEIFFLHFDEFFQKKSIKVEKKDKKSWKVCLYPPFILTGFFSKNCKLHKNAKFVIFLKLPSFWRIFQNKKSFKIENHKKIVKSLFCPPFILKIFWQEKEIFNKKFKRLKIKWIIKCTWIIGAWTQAPRHSTSDKVNNLSFVVSPTLIPKFSLMAFKISSDPRSQQGVVVHNCKWYFPTGFLINMV